MIWHVATSKDLQKQHSLLVRIALGKKLAQISRLKNILTCIYLLVSLYIYIVEIYCLHYKIILVLKHSWLNYMNQSCIRNYLSSFQITRKSVHDLDQATNNSHPYYLLYSKSNCGTRQMEESRVRDLSESDGNFFKVENGVWFCGE